MKRFPLVACLVVTVADPCLAARGASPVSPPPARPDFHHGLLTQDQPKSPPVASPVQSEAKPGPKPVPNMTDVTLGLAWGGPTHLTGSATLMWGRPKMLVAYSPGKLAQLRLGARGGQIGLGFVAGVFEESPHRPSGLAATLKAIVLRTWRDPNGLSDGDTYAGLESDIVVLGVRGSIGYTRRVSGKSGPDGRMVWSLGLGL